jgi:hypothetical protein
MVVRCLHWQIRVVQLHQRFSAAATVVVQFKLALLCRLVQNISPVCTKANVAM